MMKGQTMKPEIPIVDVQTLVRFGRLGMELFASRVLSLLSLAGFLALAGYVAYSPSAVGAAVVLVALFAFVAALRAEAKPASPEGQP